MNKSLMNWWNPRLLIVKTVIKKKKLTLDCWLLFRSDNGQLIEGNHTVVATARGVFDHQGGVLESPETGKLDVHDCITHLLQVHVICNMLDTITHLTLLNCVTPDVGTCRLYMVIIRYREIVVYLKVNCYTLAHFFSIWIVWIRWRTA